MFSESSSSLPLLGCFPSQAAGWLAGSLHSLWQEVPKPKASMSFKRLHRVATLSFWRWSAPRHWILNFNYFLTCADNLRSFSSTPSRRETLIIQVFLLDTNTQIQVSCQNYPNVSGLQISCLTALRSAWPVVSSEDTGTELSCVCWRQRQWGWQSPDSGAFLVLQ